MQDKFHCSVILLWFDITQAEVIFLRPLASMVYVWRDSNSTLPTRFFFTLSRMNGKCSTNRASDIWFTVSRRFHFHISRQINRDRYLPKMCAVRPPPSPARETHIDRCVENRDRPQPIHHLFCVECWMLNVYSNRGTNRQMLFVVSSVQRDHTLCCNEGYCPLRIQKPIALDRADFWLLQKWPN